MQFIIKASFLGKVISSYRIKRFLAQPLRILRVDLIVDDYTNMQALRNQLISNLVLDSLEFKKLLELQRKS